MHLNKQRDPTKVHIVQSPQDQGHNTRALHRKKTTPAFPNPHFSGAFVGTWSTASINQHLGLKTSFLMDWEGLFYTVVQILEEQHETSLLPLAEKPGEIWISRLCSFFSNWPRQKTFAEIDTPKNATTTTTTTTPTTPMIPNTTSPTTSTNSTTSPAAPAAPATPATPATPAKGAPPDLQKAVNLILQQLIALHVRTIQFHVEWDDEASIILKPLFLKLQSLQQEPCNEGKADIKLKTSGGCNTTGIAAENALRKVLKQIIPGLDAVTVMPSGSFKNAYKDETSNEVDCYSNQAKTPFSFPARD
eukprot:TRINITY_DN3708_c0_g1_i1.p1 TRINITY_DN3708_c0_g1~~TRINITY_DN3708_c0_g1_i1.p1  ORF type:complete len:304 (+),score=61.61 TRINITY_DN3708_c0_g1_i1:381-1292(+)